MNFLGNLIGVLILAVLFAILMAGDKMMCDIGKNDIATFEACMSIKGCYINSDLVHDYIVGQGMVERYCNENSD